MLKTIILGVLLVLTAVNLILLWQVFRKLKQNRQEKVEVSMDYIQPRLIAFGICMTATGLIGISMILLKILFRAP